MNPPDDDTRVEETLKHSRTQLALVALGISEEEYEAIKREQEKDRLGQVLQDSFPPRADVTICTESYDKLHPDRARRMLGTILDAIQEALGESFGFRKCVIENRGHKAYDITFDKSS